MLRNELEKLDSAHVLAVSAGLQLVEGNVHHLYRLERLASFAARRTNTPTSRLSTSAVRRALRTPEIGSDAVRLQEDEFEGFLTIEVPFIGSTYLVLQGLFTDSAAIARNLLCSIFGTACRDFPAEYTRRISWAANLLLRTSATIAERQAFRRFEVAPERDQEISVPAMPTLDALAARATFDEAELLTDFTDDAVDYLQSRLFTDRTSLPAWDGEGGIDDAIVTTPFIRTPRGVVIAAPFELMAALRHLIGVEAIANDCSSILTAATSEFAAREATKLFGMLCDDGLEEAEHSSVHHRIFHGTFDTDKVLDLRIHVESFDAYDPTTLDQPPVVQLGSSGIPRPEQPIDKTLVVDAVWTHGSGAHSFTENNGSAHLAGLYTAFETILFSPGTNDLTLWYFAQALARPSAPRMFMTSLEDAFSNYYSGNERSFYVSDDTAPTGIYHTPGGGEDLRRTIAKRYGKTYVHDTSRTYEAVLVHGASTTVRQVICPGSVFFMELACARAWVECSAPPQVSNAITDGLAEATCFWLYEIGNKFPELFAIQSITDLRVDIKTEIWSDKPDGNPESWITTTIDDSTRTITLSIANPPIVPSSDPPNILDRFLVTALLDALTSAAPEPVGMDLKEVLAKIAPPGERRMLHIAEANSDPVRWPGKLPKPRRIESAVVATLLDDLGAHLTGPLGHNAGPITSDQQSRVLNSEVVPYFGNRLTALLVEHDDRQLLRFLVRANESLLREARSEQKMFPSRIACFGEQSDIVERYARNITDDTNASVASRFLIEYLSGNPTTGERGITDENYDMMLALASEVVNKGFLSDAIHAEISTTTISILPSGRFGIARDDDRWVTGLQRFLQAHASALVASVTHTAMSEHSQSDGPVDTFDLTPHDKVATIEFGFSFSELRDFVGKVVDISVLRGQEDVGELEFATIRKELSSAYGWDVAKIDRIVSALSLTRESNFWKLGPSVHPWRYNRDRSYLRRPMIRRDTRGDSVIFGHRNTILAPLHWYAQYASGRLRANTPEMKRALSEATNRKGELFEIQAEEVLSRVCGPVRRRVTRIGKYDLRNVDGTNLGDIDLVAYHSESRTLLLIEAKSLEAARTPAELRNEIENILEGPHSAVIRLNGRYRWALKHIDDLRNEFNLPAGSINLMPVIVIEDDLMARTLDSSPFPIIPLAKLADEIADRHRMKLYKLHITHAKT